MISRIIVEMIYREQNIDALRDLVTVERTYQKGTMEHFLVRHYLEDQTCKETHIKIESMTR